MTWGNRLVWILVVGARVTFFVLQPLGGWLRALDYMAGKKKNGSYDNY